MSALISLDLNEDLLIHYPPGNQDQVPFQSLGLV